MKLTALMKDESGVDKLLRLYPSNNDHFYKLKLFLFHRQALQVVSDRKIHEATKALSVWMIKQDEHSWKLDTALSCTWKIVLNVRKFVKNNSQIHIINRFLHTFIFWSTWNLKCVQCLAINDWLIFFLLSASEKFFIKIEFMNDVID